MTKTETITTTDIACYTADSLHYFTTGATALSDEALAIATAAAGQLFKRGLAA